MKQILIVLFLGAAGCNGPVPVDIPVIEAPDASVEPADAGPLWEDAGTIDAGGRATALDVSLSAITVGPARDHHTTHVVELEGRPFLYVVGGTDSWASIHSDILRAAINADGGLDPFEKVGELPQPRAAHAAVVFDNRLVVAGGLTQVPAGRYAMDSTVVATLLPDGGVGPWAEGPRLPMAVMHHSCETWKRQLFCVGGRIAGNFTAGLSVAASMDASGMLSPYQPVTALPKSRGFHQSFVHGDALYLVGGLHRDAPAVEFERLKDVIRAPVLATGLLGGWENAGELPAPVQVASAQVFRDRVYILGGMDGADLVSNQILSAAITPEGKLADVQVSVRRLAQARMHVHQTPLYKQWLYSVGGRRADDRSMGAIEIGVFY